MAKSNIRSMRFSDQIIELIEAQVGDTFTAKFEALVTKCCWELPMKEQQLAEIKKQIDNERKNLRHIRERKQKLDRIGDHWCGGGIRADGYDRGWSQQQTGQIFQAPQKTLI